MSRPNAAGAADQPSRADITDVILAGGRGRRLGGMDRCGRKEQTDPGLDGLLAHLDQDCLDLMVVEGFKHAAFPKIELYRPTIGRAPLYPGDRNIVAIAADAPSRVSPALTVLNINDAGQVADFIRAKKDRPAFDHGDRGTGVRNRTALMFLQTLPDRRPR